MFYFGKKSKNLRKVEKLFHQGRYPDALNEINTLISAYPQDDDLKLQRIWLNLEMKKFDAALEETDLQLKTSSENPVLLMLKGECHLEQKAYEQAAVYLSQSLDYAPDNLRTKYSLSKVYLAQDEFDKASELLEDVVKYNKTFVQSRLLMMAELHILDRKK